MVGMYSERAKLLLSIKENIETLQKHLETFNFYDQHTEKGIRDLSKESAEFLWFQLFKNVVLSMPRDVHSKQQLVEFCRPYYRRNREELQLIDEFEKEYTLNKSIRWYSKQCFLYKLVNKALKTEDIEQLHTFRFFIADLSSNLYAIHQQRRQKDLLTLYRGSKMEKQELDTMNNKIGSLISLNGFLSTSRSKDMPLKFATKSTKRTNIFPVLYEIECNLEETKSIVFADITQYSEFAGEQEVLFDIGSAFRIVSVYQDSVTKLWIISLKATDEGVKVVNDYIEYNRNSNEETSKVILFGILLGQMGKYDQSRKYFQSLLTNPQMEPDTARIYNEIGCSYLNKSELDKAYQNFERSYKMMKKAKPKRKKDSIRPLTNMALVLLRREEPDKSLKLLFKVLKKRERYYSERHLEIGKTLNNIGNVYFHKQYYDTELHCYEESLKIQYKHFPNENYIDTAKRLNNIALIYSKMNNFDRALVSHENTLKIRKKLLPSDHKDIVQSLMNIGNVYRDMGNLEMALGYLKEALKMQEKIFEVH